MEPLPRWAILLCLIVVCLGTLPLSRSFISPRDEIIDTPLESTTALGLEKHTFPATYRAHPTWPRGTSHNMTRLRPMGDNRRSTTPEITAIVLNWSRFQNVVQIATNLCSPVLESTIDTVLVWNNNPNPVDEQALPECGGRLYVYNSPRNMYFEARFIACMQATTEWCFVQDDDYLILPEVILAMADRINMDVYDGRIFLLPPHEVLSSKMRSIYSHNGAHTSFAWLGHGAMISPLAATDFLTLMRWLKTTEEERQMADNYFSILRNNISTVWFDQGIELGGGQAFTVGNEGELRNRHHIMRACELLDQFLALAAERRAEIQHKGEQLGTGGWDDIPFVLWDRDPSQINMLPMHTACRGPAPCILQSNIAMLPPTHRPLDGYTGPAMSMLDNEDAFMRTLSEDVKSNWLEHPISKAVDGLAFSYFQSLYTARMGDWISLSMVNMKIFYPSTQLALLVDAGTAKILQECTVYLGSSQVPVPATFECTGTLISEPELHECSMTISRKETKAVAVRIQAKDRVYSARWRVHEIWLRTEGSSLLAM
ncbi:hypothetical protein CYLTODRAFT_416949 [Cylindrobasidium torrendii FP15055 ss-10]|uniref:Glycosyltransferase family 2 protein n=1 Tax=Cylindrobasidium torrendii FP15055 ss-10 TaxID=1314674 RepID=A0A0D7BVB8_9AGAR|nr:hypothetical protein CYLTODRAFT_416949 [Cylindrobasidium torrendii FP15055 ss-10]